MTNLPQAPGLVGDLCEWIDSTAMKKQPVLSLAASLAYCGALMGRKVQTEWGLRSNVYTMGVAPSCSGKDHARRRLSDLTAAAGMVDLLGGEDVTSDAAIEMELHKHHTILYLWDEIGHMMGNIKSSGGGGHTAKIVPMLMKLYTSASSTYNGKSYANKEEGKRRIDQPHCCVYGTTVPNRLWSGMDSDELLDGWLGRVMVFSSTSDPKKDMQASMVKGIPSHLIDSVKFWANYQPAVDTSVGNIIAATRVSPTIIKMDAEAREWFGVFDDQCDAKKVKARKEGIGIDNLWGRSLENAHKLAMIAACGCGEGPFLITMEHAFWASCVVQQSIEQLAVDIRVNVGDNDHDRNRKKILRIIKASKHHGITRAELTRKTQWTNQRDRNGMILELEESEDIGVGFRTDTNKAVYLWRGGE